MSWALRLLLTLAGLYLVIVLLAFLFQRRLMYFPTRTDPARASAAAAQQGIAEWRTAAGDFIGWRWPASTSSDTAVLILHGNAGSAINREYLADPIREASSLDAFVLEYPGYGFRDGSPGQDAILAAAEQAFRELSSRNRVFLVGESIGAGAAAHLARRFKDKVAGVVLFAPFDSLQAVARKVFPFLPIRWILRDQFEPAAWLAEYGGPVTIVLAERDEVIPVEFGHRLHDFYKGPKKLIVIPNAGHNDIPAQPVSWWRDVLR
jgi:pimeloyl-ACP methyl ester carboxylesterase